MRFIGLCFVATGALITVVCITGAIYLAVMHVLQPSNQVSLGVMPWFVEWRGPLMLAGYAVIGLVPLGIGVWFETKTRPKAQ